MLDNSSEYRMRVNKLMIEFNAGRLPDNEFFDSFMPRVKRKVANGQVLSDLEKSKIDELFDQY